MYEYATVSASSYDSSSLAGKLTAKSAEGWELVSIVPTGGDVTAFLRRETTLEELEAEAAAAEAAAAEAVAAEVTVADVSAAETADAASSAAQTAAETAAIAATHEVETAPQAEPVSEPAGWAVAPAAAAAPDATPSGIDTTQAMAPIDSPSSGAPEAATSATAPVVNVPAGWYADPSGRYELRYWDGQQWTEHVARGGQQYTDPPVA
jgi:hypothetical protein